MIQSGNAVQEMTNAEEQKQQEEPHQDDEVNYNDDENNQEDEDEENDEQQEQGSFDETTHWTNLWNEFRTMPFNVMGMMFMLGMMFQSICGIMNWVLVSLCTASFLGGSVCGMLVTSQYEPVGVFVNYLGRWLSFPRAVCHMPMARFDAASVVLTSATSIGTGVNAIASGVEAVANAMST